MTHSFVPFSSSSYVTLDGSTVYESVLAFAGTLEEFAEYLREDLGSEVEVLVEGSYVVAYASDGCVLECYAMR